MSSPLVSVVVATYKQERSLVAALESLANQTYDAYEIILVDDNGDPQRNEKVSNIVDSFVNKYPQVALTYIVNNPNQGSAKTRNIGIDRANGEYVTFLDDDDLYLPEKISRQVKSMEAHHADYSITDLFLYNENDQLIDKRIRTYVEKTDKDSLLEYHMLYHMTGTDAMMFKREYLRKIGGFNEIDLGDEFYLMEKAISAGGVFCYSPGCDIKAYVHTGEVGLSSGQNKITCENQLFEYKKKSFHGLSHKARRYITMRHYAVLAFAGLRMRKPLYILKNGVLSFFVSPLDCCKLVVSRSEKIMEE